jgi:hypothetical protein
MQPAPSKCKLIELLPFDERALKLPRMPDDVFDELVGDMQRRGFRPEFPIITHNGKIISGVHRARACVKAGVEPVYLQFDGNDEDVERFIIQAEFCRRHLSPQERRNELKKLLNIYPGLSDRTIATMANVSPTTVGKVRSTVQPGQLGKRIGKDGKARRQPSKPTPKPEPVEITLTTAEYNDLPAVEPMPVPLKSEPAAQVIALRSDSPPDAIAPEVIEEPTGGAPEPVKESPEELPACAAGAWWEQDDETIAQTMASHMSCDRIWEIAHRASALREKVEPLVGKDSNDDPPPPRGRRRPKPKIEETSLAEAIHSGFDDWGELAEECRELVDNAPPGISETQRIQTFDETASVLEGLEEPKVADELADIKVSFPVYKARSRAARCCNARDAIEVCIEALALHEGDPRSAAAKDLRDVLQDAVNETENCEFPGMFG